MNPIIKPSGRDFSKGVLLEKQIASRKISPLQDPSPAAANVEKIADHDNNQLHIELQQLPQKHFVFEVQLLPSQLSKS